MTTRTDPVFAVAVGTSHAMTAREAAVDAGLIRRLSAGTGVPLVLHGSSGLPDDQVAAAVQAGIAKVNISTRLNLLFADAVNARLREYPASVDPHRYVAASRGAAADEAERLLLLLRR